MRTPALAWSPGLLTLLALLSSPRAAASGADAERGVVRLHAGLASHQALLVAGGVPHPHLAPLSGDGGVSATLYGEGPVGVAFALERESVRLRSVEAPGEAFQHQQVRGSLALAARGALGPLHLGFHLGYALIHAPHGAHAEHASPEGLQHAVLVSPRVRLPLPWWALEVEASGELWLSLRASDGQHRPLESRGGAAGLALGRRMGTVGPLAWSLWLDAQATHNDSARGVGDASYFRATRLGVSTELSWDAGPAAAHPRESTHGAH